jgi:hypothetical protein
MVYNKIYVIIDILIMAHLVFEKIIVYQWHIYDNESIIVYYYFVELNTLHIY